MKEPLHPGKVLTDILISEGFIDFKEPYDESDEKVDIDRISRAYMLDIDYDNLKSFLNGESDISHVIAYKLGKGVEGTDMAFWLKLQEDYDRRDSSLNLSKYISTILEAEALRIEELK